MAFKVNTVGKNFPGQSFTFYRNNVKYFTLGGDVPVGVRGD